MDQVAPRSPRFHTAGDVFGCVKVGQFFWVTNGAGNEVFHRLWPVKVQSAAGFLAVRWFYFSEKHLEKQSEITVIFHFSLCLWSTSCSLEWTDWLFLYWGTKVKNNLHQIILQTKTVESDPVLAWPLHTSGSICAARAGPTDPCLQPHYMIHWSISFDTPLFSLFFPVVNSPASFIRSAFSACRPLARGCRPEKVGDKAASGQQRFECPAPRSHDETAMGPECVFCFVLFFFNVLLPLNYFKQQKSSIICEANAKYVWKRNIF